MKRFFMVFILLLLFLPVFGQSDEKPTIAIMDVVPEGVSQTQATLIYEFIIDRMNRSNAFTLVERSALDRAMEELKISSSGIIDESTAAEIGKVAGAKFVLVTSVIKEEGIYYLSMRVVNVETSKIANTAINSTDTFSEIDQLTEIAVAKLFDISTKDLKSDPKGSSDAGGPSIKPADTNIELAVSAGVAIPVGDVTRVFTIGGTALVKGTFKLPLGKGSLGLGLMTGALIEPTHGPFEPESEVTNPYLLLAIPLFAEVDYSIPISFFILGIEAGGGVLFNTAILTPEGPPPPPEESGESGFAAGANAGLSLSLRVSPTMTLSLWGDFLMIFYQNAPYTGIVTGLRVDMGL